MEYPLINDMLEWQKEIDKHGIGVNMMGSARFWSTVADKGVEVVYRNGAPEFNNIVIKLDDKVGLELSTEEENHFIKYRFVDLNDYE